MSGTATIPDTPEQLVAEEEYMAPFLKRVERISAREQEPALDAFLEMMLRDLRRGFRRGEEESAVRSRGPGGISGADSAWLDSGGG